MHFTTEHYFSAKKFSIALASRLIADNGKTTMLLSSADGSENVFTRRKIFIDDFLPQNIFQQPTEKKEKEEKRAGKACSRHDRKRFDEKLISHICINNEKSYLGKAFHMALFTVCFKCVASFSCLWARKFERKWGMIK